VVETGVEVVDVGGLIVVVEELFAIVLVLVGTSTVTSAKPHISPFCVSVTLILSVPPLSPAVYKPSASIMLPIALPLTPPVQPVQLLMKPPRYSSEYYRRFHRQQH